MSPLLELGSAVRTRRADMGLTQTALAKLSGLSRATVNQVEAASIKDLSLTRVTRLLGVLGLSVTVGSARPARPARKSAKTAALELAARSAGVSYRTAMGASDLRKALLQGEVPHRYQPHVGTLLEEASVALLAAVVEQLHTEDGLPRTRAWEQMRELARTFKSARKLWQ